MSLPECKISQSESEADFTSQAAAAKHAGVGIRTIQRWKAKGMPVVDLGGDKVGYTKTELDRKSWAGRCKKINLDLEKIQSLYAKIEEARLILDGLRVEFEKVFYIVPDNDKQHV